MDCLHITGIRAYGYIGVLPEEQVLGQWFEVDLSLWLDLSIAGESDRLEDTYNYAAAVEAVQELVQSTRCQLIEKLAETIAERIFSFGKINQVKVKVKKLTPPIAHFDGQVSVEITRTRPVVP